MEKDKNSNAFFDKLQEKGAQFRSEMPENAWSRIESKLDRHYSTRHLLRYKLVYNAAMVLLLVTATGLTGYYLWSAFLGQDSAEEHYARNIQDLETRGNTYPVYSVHKLMSAYSKLNYSPRESMEAEVPEGSSDIQGQFRSGSNMFQ